jgi:hypothetical protein
MYVCGATPTGINSSPVWGRVLFTNTKSAVPGDRCNLERSIEMNCPTGISHGTRYLQSPTTNCQSAPLNKHPGHWRYAYFLFSISGRLVLENLSTTTCKCKYGHNDEATNIHTTHFVKRTRREGYVGFFRGPQMEYKS